jgi:uncharacterized iron-regulated protein
MRSIAWLFPLVLAACAGRVPGCAPVGQFVSPASLRVVADPVPAAAHGVTLLGETHDRAADHQWEAAVIARLYAAEPEMAIGFEMFPRSVQPVLDAWVAGRLSEAAFLEASGWQTYWGFDAGMYLPIFRFARDHHVPMLALNVSHRLVHLVAQNGWDAVPEGAREGIGTPAAPGAAYRAQLAEAMGEHAGAGHASAGGMNAARLGHFIEAQSVWDRAMAQGIAAARARVPGRAVVAIMGAGHLEHGYGVPHQLAALGVRDVVVLLPEAGVCAPLGAGFADAVFVEAEK